jgi:hypothetical protein
MWLIFGICFILNSCSPTSDSGYESFSYKNSYTFNFSTDSVSIVVQQSPGEIERSGITEPTITVADSTLPNGQMLITFDVKAYDMPAKPADPPTEFSAFSDSLHIWYSATPSHRFEPEGKQKGGQPVINTPPAVPALPIQHIDIRKSPELNVNFTYIKNN